MSILGRLDIHRKQLTFDCLDTATGQVTPGQVAPADREHLRAWLARFAGRDGRVTLKCSTVADRPHTDIPVGTRAALQASSGDARPDHEDASVHAHCERVSYVGHGLT